MYLKMTILDGRIRQLEVDNKRIATRNENLLDEINRINRNGRQDPNEIAKRREVFQEYWKFLQK